MSKEKYTHIIDDAYENALLQYGFQWLPATQAGTALESRESFIRKIKVDNEFSERFGLKIEERELSLEERTEILKDQSDNKEYFYDNNGNLIIESEWVLNKSNIPTKLITVTYNNETIESYE